jgi:hypothetical protein
MVVLVASVAAALGLLFWSLFAHRGPDPKMEMLQKLLDRLAHDEAAVRRDEDVSIAARMSYDLFA